jgi:hypothetical protein
MARMMAHDLTGHQILMRGAGHPSGMLISVS